MSVQNGGFVDVGTRPGLAANWTLTVSAPTTLIAPFGDPLFGFESFVWFGPYADVSTFPAARFGGPPRIYEDFELGWLGAGTAYYTDLLPPALSVSAGFYGGTASDEDFRWGNVSGYWTSWDAMPGGLKVAATDESFEPAGYITAWGDVVSTEAALFDADPSPVAFEDFSDWTLI